MRKRRPSKPRLVPVDSRGRRVARGDLHAVGWILEDPPVHAGRAHANGVAKRGDK
jgi:hypothetical protein